MICGLGGRVYSVQCHYISLRQKARGLLCHIKYCHPPRDDTHWSLSWAASLDSSTVSVAFIQSQAGVLNLTCAYSHGSGGSHLEVQSGVLCPVVRRQVLNETTIPITAASSLPGATAFLHVGGSGVTTIQ